jgi:hypothetical protein
MMPAIIHGQSLRSDDDFCKNQLGGGVQMSKSGKNHKLSDTQFIKTMSNTASKHTNQLIIMPAIIHGQLLRSDDDFCKNQLGGGVQMSKSGKNHKLSDTQFINSMSKPTSKHTNQLVMIPAIKYVQWLRPGAHFWKNRLGGGAKMSASVEMKNLASRRTARHGGE